MISVLAPHQIYHEILWKVHPFETSNVIFLLFWIMWAGIHTSIQNEKKTSWILTNKEHACSVITSRKMFYRFSDQMIMHLKWSIKFDEDFKISQCKKWTRWGKISNLHSFISHRETGPACLYRRRINHTQIHYIYCDVMYQNWTAWYR